MRVELFYRKEYDGLGMSKYEEKGGFENGKLGYVNIWGGSRGVLRIDIVWGMVGGGGDLGERVVW